MSESGAWSSDAGGLGESPVELGAADAEQLRCLGHVAVCLCQGLLDKGDPVRRGRSPLAFDVRMSWSAGTSVRRLVPPEGQRIVSPTDYGLPDSFKLPVTNLCKVLAIKVW